MSTVANWLLLRGLSREKRQWGTFPEVLEARIPGVKAHRLDLPGVGTENGRHAPALVEEMVDDLRARWAPLREAHPGRWGILGVSLGGMVTMEWVYLHATDFAAAVVVNSSAADLSLPQERLRLSNLPAILRVVGARDPVERELEVLRLTTSTQKENQDIAAEWAGYLREHPVERRVLVRQLVAGMRFRSPPRLGPPTLFISAAADIFVAPKCTERLARKYGAPHEQHPTAGHDLSMDDAEWLAERIRTFSERAEHARRLSPRRDAASSIETSARPTG